VTRAADSPRLLAVLSRTADALDARHQLWALVGGLAVSVRAEPRFTRDIDLAVAVVDDAAAEALVSALLASGFRLQLSIQAPARGSRTLARTRARIDSRVLALP
jgi:Nucleotidyl transferase AbiEii toxin, Type IV TA system